MKSRTARIVRWESLLGVSVQVHRIFGRGPEGGKLSGWVGFTASGKKIGGVCWGMNYKDTVEYLERTINFYGPDFFLSKS